MSHARGAAAVFGALVLSFVIVACGGGEEPVDEGDTTTAVTKQEYLQQADAVCVRINRELQATFQQRDVEQAVTIMREGVSDLRALPQPEGDEEQLDQIYTAAEQAIDKFEQNPRGAGNVFGQFTKLAQEYGFEGGCTGNQGGP